MPDQLLSTKFFIPPTRPGLVTRPRLLKSVDRLLHAPLSIITAPPGFGKTTLLADWVQSLPSAPAICTAWVSLDPDDNDLARFWTYIVTALQEAIRSSAPESIVTPAFAEVLRILAATPYPHQVFLTRLINELLSMPMSIVLILDDYHVILDQAISDGITYLVDHSPANFHLVILSRTDPPLPLGRWRGRGLLNSLRAQDLRFSLEEALEFLNRSMGLCLSPESVAELDQRTEGWAAGLQMAAFALMDKDEAGVAETIRTFSGRHHFLLDYFTDEILQRQPEETQHFLLSTSILARMCAELCAAVLIQVENPGRSALTVAQSQAMLESLERANLFLVPLDTERRWYRYHHLFNDLLLSRLRQAVGKTGEADLRRRAAQWHSQQGHLPEAISQALQAQDYDQAADLIECPAQAIQIWESGEVATILRWIQQLPPEAIQEHLWLRLYQSRSEFFRGQADESEAILDTIEQQIRKDPARVNKADVLLGMVLSHRARYASVRGKLKVAQAISKQALEVLPPSEKNARNFVLPTLAYSAYLLGNVEEATRMYEESALISGQLGSHFGRIGTLANLARAWLAQGKLRQAIQVANEAIEEGTIQGHPLPVTGWAHFPLAEALYEQNDLANAERTIRDGLRLVEEGQLTDYFGLMPALLARIQCAQGKIEEAEETIGAALSSARRTSVPVFFDQVKAFQAEIWLQSGQIDLAKGWVESYQGQEKNEIPGEIEDITLARVLLASGRAEQARALLAPFGEDAQKHSRYGSELAIRALLALASQTTGDEQAARQELERALALGELEGYIQPFLRLGDIMESLLRQLARDKDSFGRDSDRSGYILKILSAFQKSSPETQSQAARHPQLAEALTGRDMDVLRLLEEGLSNREIAARLYLSPNTLRVYTTNLYSKLYVHNRTQAVKRARDLGLI